jgi:TonB family protein
LAAGPRDVAGLAAVRTIVQPVDAEPHSFEAFADGAVFIAGAEFLGFVALHAENLLAGGHRCLRKKLYLRERRAARGGWGRRYIEGTVLLMCLIGADGSVKKLDVVTGHEWLVPAAIEAVSQWKYEPLKINGKAAEADSSVRIIFEFPKVKKKVDPK